MRFWEEKCSLSRDLATVQTTTETSVQGWEVLRLGSLVLKTAPSYLLGRRRRMCAEVPGPLTSANSWSVFAISGSGLIKLPAEFKHIEKRTLRRWLVPVLAAVLSSITSHPR